MQTSADGLATLEHEEGVVLRAYRCPAGVWTIGAGLTAASGVVKPRAGMVISRAEATKLLQKALRNNYEPAVAHAMPGAKQHEFDAGLGFHFNTGAIRRATWVKVWATARQNVVRGSTWDDVRLYLLAWNKGGGKVLPGLTKRRQREFMMLERGIYPVQAGLAKAAPVSSGAVWAVPMTDAEKVAVQEGLRNLGYLAGPIEGVIPVEVVSAFQAAHGLTVDAIIGRATLSTLQRMLDARAKALPVVVAAPAPAAIVATGTDAVGNVTGLPYFDVALLGAFLAFAGYLAWTYRDAIAAAAHDRFPRLAGWLRSV